MASSSGATHILVFPYPAQGHLLPLLDFTHRLLTRGAALNLPMTVTLVTTPNNLPLLQPLLSSHAPSSLSPLLLPFPPHPSLPSGAENTQHLPPDSLLPVMSSLRRLLQPLLLWFSSHPNPPSSLLSDMFLGWTHPLAQRLHIKRFVFSPSGALALSIIHSLWTNPPSSIPDDDHAVVSFDTIPGKPRFHSYQLSSLYRAYASGAPETEFLKEEFLSNISSWGFVFNTFTDLERDYLGHMKGDLGHERVWAIGPVLPPESEVGYGPKGRGGSGPAEEEVKVLSWLDECGDAEVVYVCFGSQAVLSNQQMEVLALGLERSGVRFVWKVKGPNNGHVEGESFGKLPPWFEDRVGRRGLVVRGWAPQVLILRHTAVGAFLTHCGWNSILEGLGAGVMMLAWPLGADQFSNAVLLVDQLKVGVTVGQGNKSLPDPDELARILAGSVSGACKEHRARAVELKKMATEAVTEGGSSMRDLDGLINHLFHLPKPDKDVIRGCEKWVEEKEVAGDQSGISS